MAGSELAVRRTRRRWPLEVKLAIVAEAKRSVEPVSVIARRYGMNANHLFNWLQKDRDGTLDRGALYGEAEGPMAFVSLGEVGRAQLTPAPVVEVEFPGGTRVRVGLDADPEALRRVLAAAKAAL